LPDQFHTLEKSESAAAMSGKNANARIAGFRSGTGVALRSSIAGPYLASVPLR
jgi:hypothetical protein